MMANQQSTHLKMINQQQARRGEAEKKCDTTSSSDNTRIDAPTRADVLCGRGKMCFHHEGNDHFRMLIAEYADTYKIASTKKAKMQVVMLVVEIVVARGGRFLIRDGRSISTCWVDGGHKQGKKKTGHAFRDALRGRVKCITQMREKNSYKAMLSTTDDSSHSSSSSSSSSSSFGGDGSGVDAFDLDTTSEDFNPTPIRPNLNIEPSSEWKTSNFDSGMANDLLDFFISEEIVDDEQSTIDNDNFAML